MGGGGGGCPENTWTTAGRRVGKVRYKSAGAALDHSSIAITVTVIVIAAVTITIIGRVVPGRLGVVEIGARQIEGGVALVEGIVDLLQDEVLVILVVSVACQSAASASIELSVANGQFASRERATLPQDGERGGGSRGGLEHLPRRPCMATAAAASVSTLSCPRAVRLSSVVVTFCVGRAATAASTATAAAAAAAATAAAAVKVLGAGLGLQVVGRAGLVVVCPAGCPRLPPLLWAGTVDAGPWEGGAASTETTAGDGDGGGEGGGAVDTLRRGDQGSKPHKGARGHHCDTMR